MVYTENEGFEWSENKNLSNFKKHGVYFEQAILVFYDKNCFIEDDIKHSIQEDREYAIGNTAHGILFVVYTIRLKPFRNRIISARKATKKEKEEYEKRQTV